MVTFSTDYWAPAMEVNVRRRQEKSPLHAQFGPSATNQSQSNPNYLSNGQHWSTLRQVPTLDAASAAVLSNLASNNNSASSLLKKSKPSPVAVPSKKQTLIHKIFHHEHKPSNASSSSGNGSSNQHSGNSPPTSPDRGSAVDEEDPYLIATGSPASIDKKSFFNLANVLGRPSSNFGSDRGDNHHPYLHGSMNGANGAGPNGQRKPGSPDCTLLKKYGICEKGNIGQGATAVVRLAHKLTEEESEKLFAVKEFRKRRKNETEKEYVKKLMSEFCISSTLHHENIVETVDLVQDEHQHWCEVMEYCCGGDLYNAIKQNYMARVEIDCCFKQLINGVAYLHSMGVAHRDIKPENLLLDGKGRLKITDFGVSDVFRMCWEKSPHLSKGLCGSEPYIAPEEFKSKEYDARRVDIWACGIVYYCMVYQGIPFRAAMAQDPNYKYFVEMRAVNNYEPFEKLPEGCRKLMKQILDPNPETRITIEEILEDEWFKSIESCVHGENQSPHRHFEPSA